MTVRTKWHRLRELLASGEVYTPAPIGGKAEHFSENEIAVDQVRAFYENCSSLPKFVIDNDALDLVLSSEGQLSILDMQRAGVLRLPFPAMIVEIPVPQAKQHLICVLRDVRATSADIPWIEEGDPPEFEFYGIPALIHNDDDGDYVVISPSVLYASISKVTVEEAINEMRKPDANIAGVRYLNDSERAEALHEITGPQAWLRFLASPLVWLPHNAAGDRLIGQTYEKSAHSVGRALFAALLLMMTRGMEREVIEVERLNKQRIKHNKMPIPSHTYIRIGHVYQSDGSSRQYDERKSPRPHWRRGHIRNYRTKGGGTRPRYIPPMLVAYHGDDIANELIVPDYVVKK